MLSKRTYAMSPLRQAAAESSGYADSRARSFGCESEDAWFDYCLENDPRFLRRVAAARESLKSGRGIALEDVE